MGKVAGAALKVAAPEAAVAAKVAGKATGAGKPRKAPVPDPRQTHPGSEAARQRQAVEDVKARRQPEPEPEPDDQADEHDDDDQGGGGDEGGGRPALGNPLAGMSVPSTGSGIALGFLAWIFLARPFLGATDSKGRVIATGVAGIKAVARAKFLNQPVTVSPGWKGPTS